VLGDTPARLVLPIRVVEELDAKKYLARDNLADRARRILSALWRVIGPTAGLPVPLDGAAGVTIEVPVDDEPRRRTLDADEEILDQCALLKAVGATVLLVTGDTGMSLRAAQRKITARKVPEKYLRRQPEPSDEKGL
jgi:predicted ribonuclease YlaK